MRLSDWISHNINPFVEVQGMTRPLHNKWYRKLPFTISYGKGSRLTIVSWFGITIKRYSE